MFFSTVDGKFLLKTIVKNDEFKKIRSILFEYYKHLQHNPHSLLTRFFGLYEIRVISPNLQLIIINVTIFSSKKSST